MDNHSTFDLLPSDIHVMIFDIVYRMHGTSFVSLISSNSRFRDIAYTKYIAKHIKHKGIVNACRYGYLDYYMRFINHAMKNSIAPGIDLSYYIGVYIATAIENGSIDIIKHLLPFHTRTSLLGGRFMKQTEKQSKLVMKNIHDAKGILSKELTMASVRIDNIRVYSRIKCVELLSSACDDFWMRLWHGLSTVVTILDSKHIIAIIELLFKIREEYRYNVYFHNVNQNIVEILIEAGRTDLTRALIDDQRGIEQTADLRADIIFVASLTSQTQFIDQVMDLQYSTNWKRGLIRRLDDIGCYIGMLYLTNYNFPIDIHVFDKMPNEILLTFIAYDKINDSIMYKLLISAITRLYCERVYICMQSVLINNERAIEIINSGVTFGYRYTQNLLLNSNLEPSNEMWLLKDYWIDYIRDELLARVDRGISERKFSEEDIAIMSQMMSDESYTHRIITMQLYRALSPVQWCHKEVTDCHNAWKLSRKDSRWLLEKIVDKYVIKCKDAEEREFTASKEQREIQRYWITINEGDQPEWVDDSFDEYIEGTSEVPSEDNSEDNSGDT